MQYQKMTKAQLIERIGTLERDIQLYEEEYYSADQVSEMIDERLEEIEQERRMQLQREDAETNRRAFRVLVGGAA